MAMVEDGKVPQGAPAMQSEASGLCVKNTFIEVDEAREEFVNRGRRQCRTMPIKLFEEDNEADDRTPEHHGRFTKADEDYQRSDAFLPSTANRSPRTMAPVLLGQEGTLSPTIRGKRRVKTCVPNSAVERSPSLDSADEDAVPYWDAAKPSPNGHRRAKTCMARSPSIESADEDAPRYRGRAVAEEENAPPLSRAGRRAYFCTEDLREEIEFEPATEDSHEAPRGHRRYTTEDLQEQYADPSTQCPSAMYGNGERVHPRLPIGSRSHPDGECPSPQLPQSSTNAGTQTYMPTEPAPVDYSGMMQALLGWNLGAMQPGMMPTSPLQAVASSPMHRAFPLGFGMAPTATAATSPVMCPDPGAMSAWGVPTAPPSFVAPTSPAWPYQPHPLQTLPYPPPVPPSLAWLPTQALTNVYVQAQVAAAHAAAAQMAAMTAGSSVQQAASTANNDPSSSPSLAAFLELKKRVQTTEQAMFVPHAAPPDRSPVSADVPLTSPKNRALKPPQQAPTLFDALCSELPTELPTANTRGRRPARLWIHIYLHMQAPEFDLVPMLIGRGGCNMRKIADKTRAKVRIRGRGSGHLEPDNQQEAPTPLMVAVTTDHLDAGGFKEAVRMTLHELQIVSQRFQNHCDKKGHPFTGPYYSIGLLPPGAEESLGDILQGVSTNIPNKPVNSQIAPEPVENMQ